MERAVVSTDVGSMKEVVIHGETGLVVSPKNPHDLAEQINVLLDDESLRKRLGKMAKELIQQQYSFDDMLKRTEEAYDRLKN